MKQQSADKEADNLLVFPEYFPDDVPLKGANPANGEFYRITNYEKPTKKCFRSDFEKDPNCVTIRTGDMKICSYGISLQDTIEGARETVGRFKNAMIKRYIAKGLLHEKLGVEMQTFQKIYHHTFWGYAGVEIHSLFNCHEVVEPK